MKMGLERFVLCYIAVYGFWSAVDLYWPGVFIAAVVIFQFCFAIDTILERKYGN